MIIGIDLDDILFNFTDSFHHWHNTSFGTEHKREDIFSFNFIEDLWGYSTKDALQKLDDFYGDEIHFKSSPVKGSTEGVRKLKNDNTLFIITARPEEFKEAVEKWVEKHFPNMFQEIHMSGHSSKEYSHQKKSDVCKKLGVEIFIDDALHNAEDVTGVGIPVLLLDTPWNQGELKPLITRVHSWEEIVERING